MGLITGAPALNQYNNNSLLGMVIAWFNQS